MRETGVVACRRAAAWPFYCLQVTVCVHKREKRWHVGEQPHFVPFHLLKLCFIKGPAEIWQNHVSHLGEDSGFKSATKDSFHYVCICRYLLISDWFQNVCNKLPGSKGHLQMSCFIQNPKYIQFTIIVDKENRKVLTFEISYQNFCRLIFSWIVAPCIKLHLFGNMLACKAPKNRFHDQCFSVRLNFFDKMRNDQSKRKTSWAVFFIY